MMTVENLLSKASMRELQLIIGHKGRKREISAVVVMDAPDSYKWLKGGELILTSGYMIGNDEWQFEHLVRILIDSNASALGIKKGRFISAIPKNVIDLANEAGFPIIEIPYHFGWPKVSDAFYGVDASGIGMFEDSEVPFDASSSERFYHELLYALEDNTANDSHFKKIEEIQSANKNVYSCIAMIDSAEGEKCLDSLKRLFNDTQYRRMGKLRTHTVKCVRSVFFAALLEFTLEDEAVLDNWQFKLVSELEHCIDDFGRCVVATGSFYRNTSDLVKSYYESKEAYQIGKILWKDEKCFFYPLLSVYSALHNNDVSRIDLGWIYLLRSNQTALSFDAEETLEVYLESESLKSAASKLYIHENTLRYRLQRIEGILHLSLDKAINRNSLIAQIKWARMAAEFI